MSTNSTSITLRGEGLDCIGNLVFDGHVRPVTPNDGEMYGSCVDLMAVFSEAKNPRQYWKDHKKRLLELNPQVVAVLYRLKLQAPDGKMRLTDVLPLWALIQIALSMPTPMGAELRHRVARFSAAEIKYRMMNVARGAEWAADTIHAQLSDAEPPDALSPFEDIGYTHS